MIYFYRHIIQTKVQNNTNQEGCYAITSAGAGGDDLGDFRGEEFAEFEFLGDFGDRGDRGDRCPGSRILAPPFSFSEISALIRTCFAGGLTEETTGDRSSGGTVDLTGIGTAEDLGGLGRVCERWRFGFAGFFLGGLGGAFFLRSSGGGGVMLPMK